MSALEHSVYGNPLADVGAVVALHQVLPAAALLLGSGVLVFAVLRRRR